MKINSIHSVNLRNNLQYNSIQTKNDPITQEIAYAKLPSSKNYLAMFNFTGGNSIDLAKTYERLKEEQYPNIEIRQNIEKELNSGNIDDKTLYDFHFDRYKGILDCYSLSELKEKYPEFKNCQSAWNVDAREGTFLADWQFDKSDIFPNDEDLTLQLIKLYWGQGFSLSDLTEYTKEYSKDEKGINLHYTMAKKLNIPLLNSTYAQYLKFSNKEYNEKFTSEMSKRRKEAFEQKKQREEGEPVYIPRGPLSETHKKHISESLKKYFEEHPEAILKMSERQKEFYQNNQRAKEELSIVMNFAWNNTQEGKSVTKYLSKFLKKHYKMQLEDIDLTQNQSPIQKRALEEFWQKNAWAKEKFSIAVKKGWENLRKSSIEYTPVVLNLIPKTLSDKMKAFAGSQGLSIPEKDVGAFKIGGKDETMEEKQRIFQQAQDVIDLYEQYHPEYADNSASAKHLAIIAIENDLYYNQSNLPKSIKNDEEMIEIFKQILKKSIGDCKLYDISTVPKIGKMKVPVSDIGGEELTQIFQYIGYSCALIDCPEFIEYMNKKLDESYRALTEKKGKGTNITRFLRIN